ncbi:Protein YopB [Aeromonas jandaei]|uniref:type III secretion system translocon subunit SctE n=1 Tax=Aeromonas jandaei TaxID=650 RepID=UPI00367232BE
MNPISNERSNQVGVNNIIPSIEAPTADIKTSVATAVAPGNMPAGRGSLQSKSVELPPPLPAVNQNVTAEQANEIAGLVEELWPVALKTVQFQAFNLLIMSFTSPDEFEIELGKVTDQLGAAQKKLKLAEIEQTRQNNIKQMDVNQTKMKESEEAAEKAKKSGLAGKIFGWLSAIASIVIGAILVATGVGAAAGALLIAAGAVGVANMAVQQAAEDGLISAETMKWLGPVMTALEVAMAVVSAVVTCGGAVAGAVAKLGAKVGGKVAEVTAKIAAKAGVEGFKAGAKAATEVTKATLTTTQKVVKTATGVTDLVVNIGQGTANTVDRSLKADLQNKQADLLENRQDLTTLQAVMDKLKETLSQMTESFQHIMEMIFQMITAKGTMLQNIASRPSAI